MRTNEENHSSMDAGISEKMAEELCIDRKENALMYEEFYGADSDNRKERDA